MLELFILISCTVALTLRGHHELVLENRALRHQLTVKRAIKRPPLRTHDRLFWIALARIWPNWRTALVLVQPDTSCAGSAIGSAADGPNGRNLDRMSAHPLIRRECLDHVIIINEAHLRRVLTTYSRYYHRSRTHLGLEKDTPDHRPLSGRAAGPIIAIPEVGGLHHRYERRAT